MPDTAEDLALRIDDLRAFEREYRARLRAYLLSHLAALDEPGVAGEPVFRQVRRAISDPGSITSRNTGYGIDQAELESLSYWQARAVMTVLRPYLKEGTDA